MSIRLTSLMGNSQKLDGGAMFGNAPKALWTRWTPPDEQNRIDLACRALLVETDNFKVLFETGIGAYMAPSLRTRYGVVETHHVLLDSLAAIGLTDSDITDVVLSHLHFDHAGGLLAPWSEGQAPQLLFPNARFLVGEEAWTRATNPHPRDRASFIPELQDLLQESGRLVPLEAGDTFTLDELELQFFVSFGHTPGMLCSDLRWNDQRLVFAADLIPGTPWVHLPITMGYDRFPERVIEEKELLLGGVASEGSWLFYTHDPRVAASKVTYLPAKHTFEACTPLASFVRAPHLTPEPS